MGAVDRGKFILPSFLLASSDFCSATPHVPLFIFSFIGAESVKAESVHCMRKHANWRARLNIWRQRG